MVEGRFFSGNSCSMMLEFLSAGETCTTKLVVCTAGTLAGSQRRRQENFKLNRPSRGKTTRRICLPGAPGREGDEYDSSSR